MLNRTGKVVVSATLITVSTLAFFSAALIRGQSNLNASNVDYEQEHTSNVIANFGSLANPQQPKAWSCWYPWWCR